MKLNVEIKGQGYPILCLHGHPGTGSSMSVFTDFLGDRAQTIAPDLRGYGKSRPSGRFEMRDHLTDLTALLDELKLDRCLLLGWSLGGILALELALQDPQRFSGLILIASAARPRGNHPLISWQDLLFTGVGGTINYFLPGWKWNIEVFGKRSLFRYLVCQQTPLAYRYLAAYGVSAYLQTSNAAQKALSTALRSGYDRLEDLSKLDIPSLVLAGAEDRHITAKSSQETASHLKQCQWQCYRDTAHLFPWEIPDKVTQDIDIWLKNNPQVLS
jgi:pimeloyl-ACP methyl ester carboxylesterase